MHGAVEGIFVLEDNEASTLADLTGTTIGIVGESDRGLLLTALGIAGVSEDDVTIAVLGESAPLFGQLAAKRSGVWRCWCNFRLCRDT